MHDHVAGLDVAVDLAPVVHLGDADQDHPGGAGRPLPRPFRLADQLVQRDSLVEVAGHPAEVGVLGVPPEHSLLRRPGQLLAQPDLAVGGGVPGQHLDHHEGGGGTLHRRLRHGAEHRGGLVGVDRLGIRLEPVDAAERTELVGITGLQVVELLLAGGAAERHRDRGRLGPETGRNDPRVLLRHLERVACGGAGQPSPTVGRSAKAPRAYLSMRLIQYAAGWGSVVPKRALGR